MRRVMFAAVAFGAASTVAVTLTPFVHLAYHGTTLHLVLETTMALIAFLCAYLLYGRVRRGRELRDGLLLGALVLHGFTTLALSVLPGATGADRPDTFQTWAPLILRLLGTVIFVIAAFVPDRQLRRPRSFTVVVLVILGAVVGAIALVVAVFESRLPLAVDRELSPEASNRPLIAGHPAVWAAQLAAAALFGAAAIGFSRVATRRRDELLAWFALGSVLAAFARVNYFLFPSLYSNWVYTGDFFRLGFYLVLLIGAAREIERSWQEAAALEERRRIARDLHDGLAQELAFIAAQTRRVANGLIDRPLLTELSRAGERALEESRSAIGVLTVPLDEPLDVTLARAAEDVAAREAVDVHLRLAGGVAIGPKRREALVRIVREAITNAARHGQAQTVDVELKDGAVPVIRIVDDGLGFDTEDEHAPGFGLRSMRERAEQVGAELRIRSQRGNGTEVEVRMP